MTSSLPDFASNRPADGSEESVADRVNEMLRLMRENKITAPPLAIATAYINPAGFALLADELERAPRVRLLLGAEPEPDVVRASSAGDADSDQRRRRAVSDHQAWLVAERDTMGFALRSASEARRMVKWLQAQNDQAEPIVEVRRYTGGFLHGKAYLVEDNASRVALAGSSNMTYAGLKVNAELNLGTGGGTPAAGKVTEWFDHFWRLSEPYDLAELYGRQWDPHKPWNIYLRMLWELYGAHLDQDEADTARSVLQLTAYQRDGVARMQRLLDTYGGVLVADEVGLGKTFLAGQVLYQTANVNRQRAMVVGPAAVTQSVWLPFLEKYDISRWVKVYSYDEVRTRLDPDHPRHHEFLQDAADCSLVVIDEAHNLRNPSAQRSDAADRVITVGAHPKQVVLLTATPVNNSLTDLETLIRYFIRDDGRFAALGIPSIHDYIKRAQDMDPQNLTPEHLFDLMDQVAVRRTRRFVKENYSREMFEGPDGQLTVIKFPKPVVRRVDYEVGDDSGLRLIDAVVYALDDPTDPLAPNAWADRVRDPGRLMLARYLSSMYTLDHDLEQYQITNVGLLRSALLKRLESSPHALLSSLQTMIESHRRFLQSLRGGWVLTGEALNAWMASDSDDLDAFVAEFDTDAALMARAENFHAGQLAADVDSDITLLESLRDLAAEVVVGDEPKVAQLISELADIAAAARGIDKSGLSSADRRKVIVFTAFSDTLVPIHAAVVKAIEAAPEDSPLADYRGRVAQPIMGAYAKTHARGRSGGVDQSGRAAMIAEFAPKTAGERDAQGEPKSRDLYDILFTTDVLAEGVNLQQAGNMINYDLPWNPMRIVQRHGRIDRLGSEHDYVHMRLFFPTQRLETLLDLEQRLKDKLALANAAVGSGTVLPGQAPGSEVNLTDPEVTGEFERLLDDGGTSASLSGEEYRRRLHKALTMDTLLKPEIQELPYGSGSGFENPAVLGNGYVFCIRIAGNPTPWFRFVRVDDEWNPLVREDGEVDVRSDTLLSLRVADPGSEDTPRWWDERVYEQAFTAWSVAQRHVYDAWSELSDPAAMTPALPRAFRDALDYVTKHGGGLPQDQQIDLIGRLQVVPTPKLERTVRRVLNDDVDGEGKIALIRQALDDAGVVARPPAEPLPEVSLHEVRLVTWLAVHGTAGEQTRHLHDGQ